MQASIVIVSKDRKEELDKTLSILEKLVDFTQNEILVFLDGCKDGSHHLKEKYKNIHWYISQKSIGASAARKELYAYANGDILIGFDDDAHPLNHDFITIAKSFFDKDSNLAILAFEEIRGVFSSDGEALKNARKTENNHYTAQFVGCGFAVRKTYYDQTNGFPTWIDIYGEESCVALEIANLGFDILYIHDIKVNHRVNKEDRMGQGRNYFRFGKQLKNETFFYMVYYRNPIKKIVRLYWHNFKTYAVRDRKYFQIYFSTIFRVLFLLPKILKFRNPVDKAAIKKRESLP